MLFVPSTYSGLSAILSLAGEQCSLRIGGSKELEHALQDEGSANRETD